MKKYISLAAALLMGSFMLDASAQYVEKDENGEKVFYYIESASSDFDGLRMEDNNRNSSTSDYRFLLNASELDNKYQEWQVFPNGKEGTFAIKNGKSLRYMVNKGSWVGNYLSMNASTTKTASLFTITPIANTEDQVTITFVDDAGTTRYLKATDSAKTPVSMNTKQLANTTWAWRITGTTTGIGSIAKENVQVFVRDHRIFVTGTDDYKIFDMQGRQSRKDTYKMPGSYIVVANGKSHNVLVE